MKANRFVLYCTFLMLLVLVSCVQITDRLDLQKDIRLDMQVAPGGLSVPIGSLDTLFVDSLIKVDNGNQDAAVKLLDGGVYGISINDDLDGVSVRIEDVTLSVDRLEYSSVKAFFYDSLLVGNPIGGIADIPVDATAFYAEVADSTGFDIQRKVDDAFVELSEIGLANEVPVGIALKFKGVPQTIESLSIDSMTISFPEFLNMEYYGNDSRISYDPSNHRLILNGLISRDELSSEGRGFVVDALVIESLSFSSNPIETRSDGKYFSMSDQKVSYDGTFHIYDGSITLGDLQNVYLNPVITVAEMEVGTATGKFNPAIDDIEENVSLSLGDDLDFLRDSGNRFEFDDLCISLNLNTTLPFPLLFDMSLSSEDIDGNAIASNIVPDDGLVMIPACPAGASSRKVTVIIYNKERPATLSEDTVLVRMSGLNELTGRVPESMMISMGISVDQSAEYSIDLSRDFSVDASYDVLIPFSFRDIVLCYSDTLSDISGDIEDVSGYITRVNATIDAEVVNTIPLNLEVTAQALDADGNELKDIRLTSINVPAGSSANPVGQKVSFQLDVADGAMELLDAIKFTARCCSPDDGNVMSLGSKQYVLLENIVLNIANGIDIDLTDKKSDK